MAAIEILDGDIFIIYQFGEKDGNPIFLRIDEENVYKWTPSRILASEVSREEARKFIADGKKQDKRVFAIRCIGEL